MKVHIEQKFNDGQPAVMWCGQLVFIADDGSLTPSDCDFVAFAPLAAMGSTCDACKRQLSAFTERSVGWQLVRP